MYKQEMTKQTSVSPAEAWLNKMEAGGKVDKEVEIKTGLDLAGNLSVSFNKFFNFTTMTIAGLAILIGRICIALRELVEEGDYRWLKWADHNIPLHPKKRERCMLLASRPDCWDYLSLGMERLELLVRATSDLKFPDPIGELFRRYNILYKEGPETNLDEFKRMVDTALNMEKLRHRNITVGFDLVKRLTKLDVSFDQNLFRKLREAKASGGTEKGYLDMLDLGRGKPPAVPEEEKKLQNFNSLTVRLTEVSQHYLDNKSELKHINQEALKDLFNKLAEIKDLLIPPAKGAPPAATSGTASPPTPEVTSDFPTSEETNTA